MCLPQTPSAWADECEEKKRGCHKRSASCGSTDQLKEVRTRLGPDLLSSPVLCSIQQKQGRGRTPSLFLSPPCEIVDEEMGQQQAVGVGGEGKMEAVSLSYYWQALVNQKQPGVTSHYTLPSSCLCVHPSFPCHILQWLHTLFSLFSLSSSSLPPLQGSPPFVCLCCAPSVPGFHRRLYIHYLLPLVISTAISHRSVDSKLVCVF